MNSFSLALLISLLWLSTSRLIEVPPIIDNETLEVRFEDVVYMEDFVDKNIKDIYRKEVHKVSTTGIEKFLPCQQYPPQTYFYSTSFRHIDKDKTKPQFVIHEFEKIKKRASLLIDVIYVQTAKNQAGTVFYLLSNGMLKSVDIIQSKTIFSTIEDTPTGSPSIDRGYLVNFTSVDSQEGIILFVNQGYAFSYDIKLRVIKVIENYPKMAKIETAIGFKLKNKNYVAVGYGSEGAKIFSFANGTLTQQKTINKETSLNDPNRTISNVVDIAYNTKKNILHILDGALGVITFQLRNGKWSFDTSVIKRDNCNLIYFDPYFQDLYLNCKETYRFTIDNWPSYAVKVLPKTQISIKQITTKDNIVAFVGRNIFQIVYLQRKTAIYKDSLLDKLLFFGEKTKEKEEKYFISANDDGLLLGQYFTQPPSIGCINTIPDYEGNHRLIIKTTGNCDKQFLDSLNFYPDSYGKNDRCMYQVYKYVNIWQPAQFNLTLFFAIFGTLMLTLIGVGVWFVWSSLQLRKLHETVEEYQRIGTQTHAGGKHEVLVEEDVPDKKSKEQIQMSQNIQGNNGEQPNKELYAIE